MNEHGCVPIKLYLHKDVGGIWPVGHRLPTVAPEHSRIRKAKHTSTVAETIAVPKLHFFPIVKDLQPGPGWSETAFLRPLCRLVII